MSIALRGPALAVRTCARRLAPHVLRTPGTAPGTAPHTAPDTGLTDHDDTGGAGELTLRLAGPQGDMEVDTEVALSWFGPAAFGDRPGSETTVQALSGLMQIHGRDAGGPRRLGLEVASVAAGVLAAQAVLAAAIGRARGVPVESVETSVLEAGLLLASHRIAAATAGPEWVPAPPGPAPGPPFRSADGVWFEIETLDPSDWRAFWERLGAHDVDLGWAWRLFRTRYFRGTATLPAGLHEITASQPLAAIAAAAAAHAVSLCRVRGYEEVLADLGASAGHPSVRPLPGAPHGAPGSGGAAAPDAPGDPSVGPLAGLRVIEATSRLQGPLPTMLLGLLGAEVIRVEPPGGDLSRTIPPLVDDTGSFFLCFNRGKRTVEIDLARPAGRAELLDLVADADVFVHNWRPGKAAEWQLDPGDLARVNPRLVYTRASGWGDDPRAAELVGTDYLVQAYAAVGAGLNPDGTPPLPSRALLTDYLGGLVTGEAMLAGLYERERTGRGQLADGSLLAGAMTLQAHVLEDIAAGREKGRRLGRPLWGPLDHPIATVEGTLVVTVDDDAALHRLSGLCGLDPDPGDGQLVACLAAAPAAEWERRLSDAGIPCAVAASDLAALPADPRLSRLFEPLAGAASVPTCPWRLR